MLENPPEDHSADGSASPTRAETYEIPVARPESRESEHQAYKDTLEQAVLADRVGFHAFWTVEHHFLEEFSHCSNPEVLYGAVAARTERLRIGYGVRLTPKPATSSGAGPTSSSTSST